MIQYITTREHSRHIKAEIIIGSLFASFLTYYFAFDFFSFLLLLLLHHYYSSFDFFSFLLLLHHYFSSCSCQSSRLFFSPPFVRCSPATDYPAVVVITWWAAMNQYSGRSCFRPRPGGNRQLS